VADLRAGGGEADDQASVLGALLGPGGGGSGAGLARRDSGSSFRSSRLGPPDDMVLEAGLQARRRGRVRVWGRVWGLLPLALALQGGARPACAGPQAKVKARAPGPRRPSCTVGPLLRRVGVLPPARLRWPDTSACRRPCLCRGPQP